VRVLTALVARLPALIVRFPLPFLALTLALVGQSVVAGRPWAWHGWLLLGGGAILLGLAVCGIGTPSARGTTGAPASTPQPPNDELSAPDPAPERLIGGRSGLAALVL